MKRLSSNATQIFKYFAPAHPFLRPFYRTSTSSISLRHHLRFYLDLRHASSSKQRSSRKQPPIQPPANPYKPPARPPTGSPDSESPTLTRRTKRRLRPYTIISSLFTLTISAYITILYVQLHNEPPAPSNPAEQDNSLTLRYDTTASDYDAAVESSEYLQGITRLRKELVGLAKGRVLEVCAGTGRNLEFYDFGEKKGWVEGILGKGGAAMTMMEKKKKKKKKKTMGKEGEQVDDDDGGTSADDANNNIVTELVCVDRSAAMLDIARAKWARLHPPPSSTDENITTPSPKPEDTFSKATFLTQPADAPIPPSLTTTNSQDPNPKTQQQQLFTTTVQTHALCSVPHPALHILHLASLTSPDPSSKILLLEHGRCSEASPPSTLSTLLNYTLDRSAHRHAQRHGCWFNRDIGAVLRECESEGVIVVEKVRRPWWGGGTVWWVEARVGPALGGRGRGEGEERE